MERLFQGCHFRYASVDFSDYVKRGYGGGEKKKKELVSHFQLLLGRNTRLCFAVAENDAFASLTSQM